MAYWIGTKDAFDHSGRALKATTAQFRPDVAANTAEIESANFDRPLDMIDFASIADH